MGNPFSDRFNVIGGAIIAFLSYIFGEHWFVFAAFLFMNVADEATGWYKSYVHKKESSEVAWRGVLKKLYYWLMIAMAFCMSAVFIRVGAIIGIDLHITNLFGWFVLASLFINEVRSNIENMVEAGLYVPEVLKKGLEVTDKILKKETEEEA